MKINLDLIATTFIDVEFFLACVNADFEPGFDCQIPAQLAVTSVKDFWVVTSKVASTGQSLVNQVEDLQILFRGYEGNLGVHSYSCAVDRAKLVSTELLVNGVFSYLSYDAIKKQVIVRNDAFGVAPLYYRRRGAAWLFASHPSLIHFADDEVDLSAWLSMLQNGHVMADQSFYRDIARFPAGMQMTINSAGAVSNNWFSFTDLPPGTKRIDDSAFATVENAYLNAMDRCLRLDLGSITLPLSSGYDSRRFLGTLIQRSVEFSAVTCQTFHNKSGHVYDIDSHFAPKIAGAFGLSCELVKAVPLSGITEDARRRQTLIGTETFMHDWALPLMRWLATRPPSIVFDGLAGDTFGNSGFEIEGLHETPEKDIELLLAQACKPDFTKHVSIKFPKLSDYKKSYCNYLTQFPSNLNKAELAFLQSRTRRAISPWITMMHPPGHVVVFPYFDVEFARATLTYHPADKYKWFFQKECLRRWYPEYFDFAGSRNLPKDYPPVAAEISMSRQRMLDSFAYGDVAAVLETLKYLPLSNKLLLLLAKALPPLRKKRNWLFQPLLALVSTKLQAKVFMSDFIKTDQLK